ncbi:hypothetical protein H5410_064232 [Solanum commersonii]|uniref:Uncharacterized protein n=1 Tax=Solanum commersonii TaxID=4109 RepID=A0A9J5W051_SOLCO|nr:hypothetical protein H5410_064232 [Solanum commersonii]
MDNPSAAYSFLFVYRLKISLSSVAEDFGLFPTICAVTENIYTRAFNLHAFFLRITAKQVPILLGLMSPAFTFTCCLSAFFATTSPFRASNDCKPTTT